MASAYDEGFEAAANGLPEADNPYATSTEDAGEWLAGHKDRIAEADESSAKAKDEADYQATLDLAQAYRDNMKSALKSRSEGRSIFIAPPGYNIKTWVAFIEAEVSRLTEVLAKAGRA